MKVEIEGGKYTYLFHPDGRAEVLRYGEPWRDAIGDKFTYCMASELESLRAENKGLKKHNAGEWVDVSATMAENETLRARLAELEKQEPVGEIVRTETSHGCDRTAISWLKYPYAKYGAKLYLSPVVSPDAEKLIADHNADMAACHEQFMEVSREAMSLKAELEAARKDAERLDWLLAHSDATICSDGVYGPFHVFFRYSNRTAAESFTARGAIDAAIEQAKGAAE